MKWAAPTCRWSQPHAVASSLLYSINTTGFQSFCIIAAICGLSWHKLLVFFYVYRGTNPVNVRVHQRKISVPASIIIILYSYVWSSSHLMLTTLCGQYWEFTQYSSNKHMNAFDMWFKSVIFPDPINIINLVQQLCSLVCIVIVCFKPGFN